MENGHAQIQTAQKDLHTPTSAPARCWTTTPTSMPSVAAPIDAGERPCTPGLEQGALLQDPTVKQTAGSRLRLCAR